MLELKDSDLFLNHINNDNVIFGKMAKLTSGAEKSLVILNDFLIDEIKRKIVDNKKTEQVTKMGYAIETKRMILFITDPDKRLPDLIPFFVGRDRNTGRRIAFVNMNPIARVTKNLDGSKTYELGDANKAYTTLYSAFLAMDKFDSQRVLTSRLIDDGSVLWADMFNKPLYDAFGMNNPERNTALMYFASQFFLRYIMGITSENDIQSILKKNYGKKNDLILYMEDKIDSLQLDIYSGLLPFMDAMFNNEVTQIKGIRVANISNTMNSRFYISKFTTTYSSNALLGLCTFPYFVYNIVSAYGKSKMVKDKSFDRVFQVHKNETLSFIQGLLSNN